MFSQGLVRLFRDDDRFSRIDATSDGHQAMARIRSSRPDVAILSLDLAKPNGLEVCAKARDEHLRTRCVILTHTGGLGDARRILLAGARGVLSKEAGFEELATLVAGIAAEAPGLGVLDFASTLEDLDNVKSQFGLTRREAEILGQVGRGRTSKQIAAALFVSPRTVDSHRLRIMGKLGIANGPGLVKFALENGLL